MNHKNLLPLVLPCLLLSACGTKYSTGPATQIEVEPVEPQPVEPARPQIRPTTSAPPTQAVQSLPAAVSLRQQAEVATSANDHQRAIGLLERALRISPNDPQTFYNLALNYLAMNQAQQALQLARRGLTLNPTVDQRRALQALADRSEAML